MVTIFWLKRDSNYEINNLAEYKPLCDYPARFIFDLGVNVYESAKRLIFAYRADR